MGPDSAPANKASCVVGVTAQDLPPAFITLAGGTTTLGSLK